MSVKEHEEKYWHIRKWNLRIVFLLIYLVLTAGSIIWIRNITDEPIVSIPLIILLFGVGYGWIACVDKL